VKLRVVPARHGAIWVRSSFRIFFRRPLAFASLFAAFLLGLSVLAVLPFVGVLLVLTALPLVTQAFMIGTQRALLERPVLPTVYAEPLRAGRAQARAMLQIGLAYMLLTLLVVWLSSVVDGGRFEALQDAAFATTPDQKRIEALLADPQLALGMALRVGLACLIALPFWHAPPLVHWGAQGWAKALFFSTVACWRNKAAFAVYGITWAAVMLLFGLFANVVFAALGQPQMIAAAALPAGLMFSTVFYASLYFSFADCFEYSLDPASLEPRE